MAANPRGDHTRHPLEPLESTWLFLRHGESVANAARRLSGWEDVALTPAGEDQAKVAGAELSQWPLARVLSSDLRRARRTAAIALEAWHERRGAAPPHTP